MEIIEAVENGDNVEERCEKSDNELRQYAFGDILAGPDVKMLNMDENGFHW